MNYRFVFGGQKTTMKMKCVGEECFASEYDNIFYDSGKAEVLEFVSNINTENIEVSINNN